MDSELKLGYGVFFENGVVMNVVPFNDLALSTMDGQDCFTGLS